jgi:hypothetical protein
MADTHTATCALILPADIVGVKNLKNAKYFSDLKNELSG